MKKQKKQKPAKWIEKDRLFRGREYVCSRCGSAFPTPSAVCPGCGSVMRGKRYDPEWIEEMEFYDVP